jgi:type II secretory pathway component PulF
LEKLEASLSQGIPLSEALAARQLPPLYKRLLLAGAKSNDLPGALTLLADYYQRQHNLWTRLKGLMVYPGIVLFLAFLASVGFWALWSRIDLRESLADLGEGRPLPAVTLAMLPLMTTLWIFPIIFGLLFASFLGLIWMPRLRYAIRWRLPAFHEATLANTASTLWLLLRGGIPLPDAVHLVGDLENSTRARRELATWSQKLAAGVTKFSEVAQGGRAFPPLFVWLVSSAGDDLAAGFQKAGEIYHARAAHRSEVLLYAALPVIVLVLGGLVLTIGWIAISSLVTLINIMGSF